jgi:predicted MFS family arabinose efflux permease
MQHENIENKLETKLIRSNFTSSSLDNHYLPTYLIVILAICCGLSVANVYYAQPLLDALADHFAIPHAIVGGVMTAVQIGCALALFLVVPLGDMVRRKSLILIQIIFLFVVLIWVALSKSTIALMLGMLGVGLFGTAMTQGLIAYAATLANSKERGRVVGIVQSGVVIGLLMARSLAGFITDLSDWRFVYLFSAVLSVFMFIVLGRYLPETKKIIHSPHFVQLIQSMFSLLMKERVLQIRGMIGLLMFAAFSIFWTALVLPLSEPPFEMSHTEIGAFGLIGIVGALAAANVGGLNDRGFGQNATFVALILLLLSWVPLAFLNYSIWFLIVGIILLDMGGQAIHVINQAVILNINPDSSSRIIGCYMLFYSLGSGSGAIASTTIYAYSGWVGVCILGFMVSLSAFVFWLVSLKYKY